MKYGLGGLNSKFNPTQNNSFNTNLSNEVKSIITVGRVKSVILDETHPRFEELGGYKALGSIEIDNVKIPTAAEATIFPIARPVFSNITNYPLLNEIVYLLSLPDQASSSDPTATTLYYISTVSIWSHPHCNPIPYIPNENSAKVDSNNKSYQQVTIGSTNKISDSLKEYKLGDTFKERSNIHPLLAFEGDIIYEGRWGNSIRLGSTVQNRPNNYSSVGNNGDPIFILRNGQGNNSPEGWIPIVEDINNDLSSIYLTSTQQIPLNTSSTNYDSYSSYVPAQPNQYSNKQIILNSGRLVFNSNEDHILLSSKLTIGFNAIKGFNFDTKANFTINAPSIKLGGKTATEPILLGNITINLLVGLVDQLTALSIALQSVTTAAGPSVAPAATQLIPYLTQLKTQLLTTTRSTISKTL
jgi:hypothetical protein